MNASRGKKRIIGGDSAYACDDGIDAATHAMDAGTGSLATDPLAFA